MDIRKRYQMAQEHAQKAKLAKEQRRLEAVRMLPMLQGDTQSITGRIAVPGELPGIAPLGSQESVFGIEESQALTTKTGE